MDKTKVVKQLESLRQLDFDAIQAYEQAIEKIDLVTVRSQLESFRDDHARHVADLTRLLEGLGETPETLGRDLKGVLLEGMTALRSVTGTKGALKAMRMNEKLTNKAYEEALDEDLPDQVREVVLRNRADEARHLEYIELAIDQIVDADEVEARHRP
jgi:rubrerythrin